jgi:hypothetical protein
MQELLNYDYLPGTPVQVQPIAQPRQQQDVASFKRDFSADIQPY